MSSNKCSVRGCNKTVNQNLAMALVGGAVALVPLCWTHYKDYKEAIDEES